MAAACRHGNPCRAASPLETDWGTYAKSIHAPDGAQVQFRATSTTGAQSMSTTYKWG